MYITVHRGTQQTGGNLIEIGTDQTRLLFDAGANLPPLDGPKTEDPFELEGLTYGQPALDWVLPSSKPSASFRPPGKLLFFREASYPRQIFRTFSASIPKRHRRRTAPPLLLLRTAEEGVLSLYNGCCLTFHAAGCVGRAAQCAAVRAVRR